MENATAMAKPWEDAIHSLKDMPHVVDIRNCGILGAIQLDNASNDDPGRFAREAYVELFNKGVMVRYTGNNIALSPPLILNQDHIDQLFTTIRDVVSNLS